MNLNSQHSDKKYSQWYRSLQYFINRLSLGYPFNKVRKKISGTNNQIQYKNAILTSVTFDIKGNQNRIVIRKNCFMNDVFFYIRGDNHEIIIGEECRFSRGGNLWFEDHNGSLVIGDQSTFEDVHIAVTEPESKVTIGKNCMFAYDIDVRTGDSHSIISLENNKRINYAQDVIIGNHVWIAAHCTLLKGVTIPDNTIVATGSIVNKPFQESGVIIAGNPAQIVTEKVTWLRERIY